MARDVMAPRRRPLAEWTDQGPGRAAQPPRSAASLADKLLGKGDPHPHRAGSVRSRPLSHRRGIAAAVLTAFAILIPAVSLASTAPTLIAHGQRLRWNAVSGERGYRVLAQSTRGGRHVTSVTGFALTPAPAPGETVTYRVKALSSGVWSNPVSIAYPEAEVEREREPERPPPPERMSVGLNAGGWGPSAFADIAGAVRTVRMESRFASDTEVGAAAAAGVSVGTWLLGTGGTIGKIDPAKYASEAVALFSRYGRGGTFWQGRTDLGARNIEVLNEPGGSWAWTDPSNYAAYVNILRAVHEALAANFPAATRPKVLASWDAPNRPFGAGWVPLGGLAYCDGVTVHPYGGSRGESGGALGNRRSVEEAHFLSGKPVYVTEVGWPTATGQPSTADSQQWTDTQQAQNIAGFLGWARSTGYVAEVDIFGYVDETSNAQYGVERRDRSHKPSFNVLASA